MRFIFYTSLSARGRKEVYTEGGRDFIVINSKPHIVIYNTVGEPIVGKEKD